MARHRLQTPLTSKGAWTLNDNEPSREASTETIQLDQFLKASQLVSTGGEAKLIIQGGNVRVNGSVDTRRRRKLRHGDIVELEGDEYKVEFDDE